MADAVEPKSLEISSRRSVRACWWIAVLFGSFMFIFRINALMEALARWGPRKYYDCAPPVDNPDKMHNITEFISQVVES